MILPRVRPRAVRRVVATLLGVSAFSFALTGCQPPASLTVTDHITGLNRPWDIAFAPDGTLLYTLRPGGVNGGIYGFIAGVKTRFAGQPADLINLGEGGMMGLAVDPAFASNRRIYACFLTNAGNFNGRSVRVARFELDAGYTTLSNRTDIVTNIPVNTGVQAGRHSGCRPRFGPDGNLWIGTGDAATGTNPQDKQSLGGKVLRVDTAGNGVAGNPGVDTPASGFLPQIYTYGHRNLQGIAFRPTDGQAFSTEHGTACDDEMNLLVAGANYGWDPVPGYDESQPMTDLVKFPAAKPAIWSSGCPTIAPSGLVFTSGSQWAGWNNNPSMAVLKGTELHSFILDGSNGIYRQDSNITDQGRLRSAVQGPDGNLYITTDSATGKIIKVVPTP